MAKLCVIFDLDGTLVDSEALCNQAFVDLLPELNDTVDTLIRRYRGKKLALILSDIAHRLGRPLPDLFEDTYRQRVAELFERDLKPIPGVAEMLQTIEYPICIASSGPRAKISQALKVSGLAAHFADRIFSSYEVGSWKPEPALFLHAARGMGFKPEHCVVVEDSEIGIAAAMAAGMKALQYVSNGEPPLFRNITSFDSMQRL